MRNAEAIKKFFDLDEKMHYDIEPSFVICADRNLKKCGKC